ncbi:MAG TPA: hypothetical protein VGF62_05705 [Rhizomicrobium sp.]
MPDIRRASPMLIRMSAVVLIAATAGACSSLPDWLGGDSSPAAQPAPTADSAGAASDTGSQGRTVAEASDRYPALADTPSKAPPTTSSDEQKQVANALMADRSQAQYSAEALQAGKEPAAAPPSPASAEANVPIPPPSTPDRASAAANAPTPPPANPAAATRTASLEPTGHAPMPGTLPVEGESPPAAAQVALMNQAVSAAPMPPPAVAPAPANPTPVRQAPPAVASAAAPAVASDDAALGFQPSHAPPLDPAVAQLMGNPAPTRHLRIASVSAPSAPAPAPSYVQSGGTPAAVVPFPTNTIALDANGIAQVQSAVAAWRAKGGQAYIRVVGHSASGAPNLPADRQMTQSLERSQACATAVARELIKQGVPANRVLVDASASLSEGEQRRAEIFLQG